MFDISNPVDLDSTTFQGEIDPDTIVVIDMDEQCFKVASACEERMVEVVNTNTFSSGLFKNRTKFKDFMKGVEYEESLFDMEDVQKAEPISYAINTLKRRIANIVNKCNASMDKVEMYISGEGNFRDELPLAVKYKGQREDALKPVLLKELRKYAIDKMGAKVVNGMEADDVLSIRMNDGYTSKQKIISVSQDKDANQTSGWLLNYEKDDKPKFIEGLGELYIDELNKTKTVKGFGRKFLYFQLIYADSADNYCSRDVYKSIHGKKPKFGQITAYELLKDCESDKECLEVICNKYKEWYGEKMFEYKTWDNKTVRVTWLDVLSNQFQCAYMKRSYYDNMTIEKLLKSCKVDY